ncbi:MAG TPA: glycoside hydrolase family 127 protein [Candidatus Paceibacterota bacterium]|nr:glycoside hydrolase family 127 protein [Verrucomicrobiota bacterium]HSA12996.1 glycoside hydrolase family 127 protein [Candidatus Paceibacterota bacterium]
MKSALFLCFLALGCSGASNPPAYLAADAFCAPGPGSVEIGGWIGDKLEACQRRRIWTPDSGKVVTQLLDHKDSGGWGNWRGEYWGKWQTAAKLACDWQPFPERLAQVKGAAAEVLKGQAPDGYLGPHNPEHRLEAWDIWCRKYVLLGLLATYDLTGDRLFLEAAGRNLDNLLAELSKKQLKLVDTGHPNLLGTANSSILEPVALLYQRTGDQRYLAFAESILKEWEQPSKLSPTGLRLIETALAGKPPFQNHAYAIMSCFEGVCELYRATGEQRYLQAAVRFGQSVREHERIIDGSVSNQELFCNGARNQTELLEQPQETCATATWMKLCTHLLRLTGDPVWADELEVSLYNAMIGAMTPSGEWFTYHQPLAGERVPSHVQQQDVELSCCVMSGPRGLMTVPQWAAMTSKEGPVINLFAPGTAEFVIRDDVRVSILQETEYPLNSQVKFRVSPNRKTRFTFCIRIPAWSAKTTLSVNAQPVPCVPGAYAKLDREWSPGDQVLLAVDLRGRAVPAPSGAPHLAIMRGPVLLAMDNRLVPALEAPVRLKVTNGRVELTPRTARPDWAWMTFDTSFEVRPFHFHGHYTTNLTLCDFASAGNAWSETNLFRTWLPQPLWLSHAFPSNTWKMLEPGNARPERPKSPQLK